MIRHLRPAVVLVVLFTALTGLALPLGFVAVATAIQSGQDGYGGGDGKGESGITHKLWSTDGETARPAPVMSRIPCLNAT